MHPTYRRLFSPTLGPTEVPKFSYKTNEPNTRLTLSPVDYIEVNAEGRITSFLPLLVSSKIARVRADINRHNPEAAEPKKAEPVS